MWKTVGCRRGPLGHQLPQAVFCPARREGVGHISLFTNTSQLAARKNEVGPGASLVLKKSSHQIRGGRLCTGSGHPVDLNSTGAALSELRREIHGLLWTLRRGFNSKFLEILTEAGLYHLEFSLLVESAERAFANSLHVSTTPC
jgi:hypothetical protein